MGNLGQKFNPQIFLGPKVLLLIDISRKIKEVVESLTLSFEKNVMKID